MNVFGNISRIRNFDIRRASSNELKNHIELIDKTRQEISDIIYKFHSSDEEYDDVVDTLESNDYLSLLQEYKHIASISYDNLVADENSVLSREEKNVFLGVIKKEKSLHTSSSIFYSNRDSYISNLCQKIIENVDDLNYSETDVKYINKIISNEIEFLYKSNIILSKQQSMDKIDSLRNIMKKINKKLSV